MNTLYVVRRELNVYMGQSGPLCRVLATEKIHSHARRLLLPRGNYVQLDCSLQKLFQTRRTILTYFDILCKTDGLFLVHEDKYVKHCAAIKIQSTMRRVLSRRRVDARRMLPENLFHPMYKNVRLVHFNLQGTAHCACVVHLRAQNE